MEANTNWHIAKNINIFPQPDIIVPVRVSYTDIVHNRYTINVHSFASLRVFQLLGSPVQDLFPIFSIAVKVANAAGSHMCDCSLLSV